MAHTGSWGTPELGISEWISDKFGLGRDPVSGGSQLDVTPQGQYSTYADRVFSPQSQVLGASTTASVEQTPQQKSQNTQTGGGGGDQGGGGGNFMDYYQGWDPVAAQADFQGAFGGDIGALKAAKGGGGGDGGGGDIMQQINSSFGPAMQRLTDFSKDLEARATERKGQTKDTFGRRQELIGQEESDLQDILAEQRRQLFETKRSAAAEARNAYQALAQQAAARFGGGSSVGPALTELVQRQYMKNLGQGQESYQQGISQVQQQTNQLNQYIGQKMEDLKTWRDTTVNQINDNLAQGLQGINSQKGVLEQQKSNMKMNLLSDAINTTRAVRQQENQFKQGLATMAVNNLQQVQNRAFTPQEIKSITNKIMQMDVGGGGQQVMGQQYLQPGQETDEWEELSPGALYQ